MTVHIALIGNPEAGLTTLFNQLTGGRTHTGYFTTPENKTKEGAAKQMKQINLIQLPGAYSLSSYSVEDRAVQDFLLHGKPDAIINVVDVTSFERQLYLTLQLSELDIPLVLALNMMDEAENNHLRINIKELSQRLGIPVLPISAGKHQGLDRLLKQAAALAKDGAIAHPENFCTGYARTARHTISGLIAEEAKKSKLPLGFCCTKIMEGDKMILEALCLPDAKKAIISDLLEDMTLHVKEDGQLSIAKMRYAYLHQLYTDVAESALYCTKEQLRSQKIDKLLTHRFLAIPIFLAIMLLVFYLTFNSLGGWMSSWLAAGISRLVDWISYKLLAAGVNPAFHALVIDGVCAGIGSVLSFLPIIAVLFFFLTILEDSGYIPRVAFVMDKLLQKLGLSGRSLVPLLIGFGCSVPAIMSTRSLPGKRDRHLTIALIPFMSCSAKLPIYAMFTAAFFSEHKALIMISLYAAGILTAVAWAFILRKTTFQGNPDPLILVLPPYRVPAMKNVLLRMWENSKGFIKKAFTVIFAASILIWFLQTFDTSFQMAAHSENSLLAAIGKAAAPVFAPLGFGDWRAVTALLTGISAKEAIVSTLAILTESAKGASLSVMLNSIFTPLSAFSFLVFCLLYIPCIATLVSIRREMGGWIYALRAVFFQCTTAWLVSFSFFHIGGLFL